ncbi:MAG: hypothetical protein ACLP8A_11110 [Methylovirgula sp.]
MIDMRKTLVASLAVVTLIGAAAASTTEASAKGFGKGGWGWGVGAAIGTGLAIAAASSYYGNGDCYLARRAVVDGYGNVIGYQRVRVCD